MIVQRSFSFFSFFLSSYISSKRDGSRRSVLIFFRPFIGQCGGCALLQKNGHTDNIVFVNNAPGGEDDGRSDIYSDRPQILLRLGGMPRARARPARRQSCRRRPHPHRQDDMSGRLALAEGARHLRPRAPVRGDRAGAAGERRPAQPRPRRRLLRQLVP